MDDARCMGHFSISSEKEVNNLEEHGPTPNHVDDVNKDKRVTMESGSMPSSSMDLQDGDSESEVEEYDNETAQFMASSYK